MKHQPTPAEMHLQAAAFERAEKDHEARQKAPKRQVVLSASFQEVLKPAVFGVSPAEFRTIPAGQPVQVTAEEWTRLHQLGLIVRDADGSKKTAGAEQEAEATRRAEADQEAVNEAKRRSGKSDADWDAMPADERSQLVAAEVKRREEAAGQSKGGGTTSSKK